MAMNRLTRDETRRSAANIRQAVGAVDEAAVFPLRAPSSYDAIDSNSDESENW